MKLICIIGPQAVGKMTVGHALEKQTGLPLFHNHMTIDLLEPLFGFSEHTMALSSTFRKEIFHHFIQSKQAGLIFTYMWAFNEQADWDFINDLYQMFTENGGDVYFVELEASTETRISRNKTPHRLAHKPSKRNIAQSEAHLLASLDNYRLQSNKGEIPFKHYFRVNNERLEAEEVATRICNYFSLRT